MAITFAIIIIAGCKKKEEPAPVTPPPIVSPTDSASQTTRASDQTNVENESNQAMDEANSALGQVSTTREIQACGYTIDSSQKLIGKITLNYDGAPCNGKIRTGSITIQLPYNGTTITTWSTIGAKAILTFNNYKVLYVSNNKYMTYNGTHSVTNVNGGGWVQLYLGTPIVNKVRSNMQISFNGGTAIEWNSAKLRTLTYTGGVLKVTMAGDTTIGNYDDVAMWGINPMGDHFTIDVPTDYTYDIINPGTNCIAKPLTGVIKYYGVTHVITLTYGVDVNGYTVLPGVCPYGFSFSWTDAQTITHQVVLPY